MKKVFINSRYSIDFESRKLTDQSLHKETVLEPRLAQLLKILIEQKSTVVKRDILIQTIWQNYGSGDELLTHSVSLLRKFLNDTTKPFRIIQTIPKVGYQFVGNIQLGSDANVANNTNRKAFFSDLLYRHPFLSAWTIIILLIVIKALIWPHH